MYLYLNRWKNPKFQYKSIEESNNSVREDARTKNRHCDDDSGEDTAIYTLEGI